jgi:aspartyl-tRNA(Asn)/glutamyl-tRNA(Gln) amidotransferase subunit B
MTQSREFAAFFEEATSAAGDAKAVANWMQSDFSRLLNEHTMSVSESRITPGSLARLVALIKDGTISGKTAKDIFDEMFATGRSPDEIVKQKGLTQISDESELLRAIDEVIAASPQVVESYKAGKTKAAGSLVGQVMKATGGRANPQLVNQLLTKRLEEL